MDDRILRAYEIFKGMTIGWHTLVEFLELAVWRLETPMFTDDAGTDWVLTDARTSLRNAAHLSLFRAGDGS